MAPRPRESPEHFFARLRRDAGQVERKPIRVGGAHHTHAVCNEGGRWQLRLLELSNEKADQFRKSHGGMFMPEHAEMLSEPGKLLLEADSLDDLIKRLGKAAWPLDPTSRF